MVSTQSPNKLRAKDLANIPREQIKEIQQHRDEMAIATLKAALAEGRITADDYKYATYALGNGMGWCRLIYFSIYKTLGSPLYTTGFNPITYEIDRDENGKAINYSLKALTPLAPTLLKFIDKNNNAIHGIFPEMKSADRIIEKFETELHREYNKEMLAALDQSWENEDREAFAECLQNISPAYTRLHDIYRLTFTAKYLSDVKRLKRKFTEFGEKNKDQLYYINDNETRDGFETPLSENETLYRDIKIFMYQKIPNENSNEFANNQYFVVEIQLKIDTKFHNDSKTTPLYKETREIKGKLLSATSPEERTLYKQLISHYNKLRKTTNQNSDHEYNMVVLDKVYRIEDDYVALEVEPDNKKNGTYKQCVDFITDNYLVESYRPFDAENAFSANNELNKMCFLKLIGKLPKNFNEFAEGASETINSEFSRLQHMDRRRFAGINNIAQRYQSVIQDVINQRKRDDIRKTKQKHTSNTADSVLLQAAKAKKQKT